MPLAISWTKPHPEKRLGHSKAIKEAGNDIGSGDACDRRNHLLDLGLSHGQPKQRRQVRGFPIPWNRFAPLFWGKPFPDKD